MPWPLSRIIWPFCVVGGIFEPQRLPSSVVTAASPPSTAVVSGTVDAGGQVVAAALEARVRQHLDAQVEIAGLAAARARLALAGDADARAVLDAGRDADVDGARVAVVLQRDAP